MEVAQIVRYASETFERVKPLLAEAYANAVRRVSSRT